MLAFVLVKVTLGKEREALESLQSMENLEEIDFLFGEFDYLLKVRADDIEILSRLISNRVRKAPGVARTVTLIEAEL